MCTLSNINILHSLRSACITIFSTGGKFRFLGSYMLLLQLHPFLCTLALSHGE